jgi:nicotinamide-nucleotide adenylyltransferase
VIREVAREADELIIAIAAAADSGTEKNPFNAEERGEMIGRALQEAGIGPFIVVDVPDIHDPPRWAAYVMGKVPPFDVVVAHNTETLELFEKQGVPTRRASPFRMEEVSGTRVRQLMSEDGQWQDLVPAAVASYLETIDGPGRLRRIADEG